MLTSLVYVVMSIMGSIPYQAPGCAHKCHRHHNKEHLLKYVCHLASDRRYVKHEELKLAHTNDTIPLTEMDFINCDMSEFPFESLSYVFQLRTLFLSYNHLTHIPDRLGYLGNLERLIVSDNKIHYIEPNAFRELPNLQLINLENNHITTLGMNSLFFRTEDTSELEVILYNNGIATIKDVLSGSMPARLDLSRTKISTLEEEVFRPLLQHMLEQRTYDLGLLFELDLQGTPLKCDCRIDWLVNGSPDLLEAIKDGVCEDEETSLVNLTKTDTWPTDC